MSLRSSGTYTALTTLTAWLMMVLAVACGSDPTPTAVPIPTFSPSSVLELGLSETHTFDKLGFSMAYPAGWLTRSSGTTHLISELNQDHEKAWPSKPGWTQSPRATKGYQVSLSVRSKAELLGHFATRKLDDAMGLFAVGYSLQVPSEHNVAQMFRGEPALRVTGTLGYGRVVNCIVGHNPVSIFLLCLGAPSEQALAEFMPTWEQMLASVEPVG